MQSCVCGKSLLDDVHWWKAMKVRAPPLGKHRYVRQVIGWR